MIKLLLPLLIMQSLDFENLIGKDVSIVHAILLDKGFENDNIFPNIKSYALDEETYDSFYGLAFNIITIGINENNYVSDITIHFNQVIDSSFYYKFIIDYDKPDIIQVVDGVKFISDWKENKTENGIEQKVRKVTLNTREGSFEENPFFMIWNKEGYQIKALLRHKQNTSEITFRLPSKNF